MVTPVQFGTRGLLDRWMNECHHMYALDTAKQHCLFLLHSEFTEEWRHGELYIHMEYVFSPYVKSCYNLEPNVLALRIVMTCLLAFCIFVTVSYRGARLYSNLNSDFLVTHMAWFSVTFCYVEHLYLYFHRHIVLMLQREVVFSNCARIL